MLNILRRFSVELFLLAALLLSFVACGGGGGGGGTSPSPSPPSDSTAAVVTATDKGSTSVLSFTIGSPDQVASISGVNSFSNFAKVLLHKAIKLITPNSANAVLSSSIYKFIILVDADGINTIQKEVLVSGNPSVSFTIEVPNNVSLNIFIIAQDSSGSEISRTSASATFPSSSKLSLKFYGIKLSSPTNATAYRIGQTITVQWSTTDISSSDSISIYMIRDSIYPTDFIYSWYDYNYMESHDWYVLNTVLNTGTAQVIIPEIEPAGDWRFFVKHVSSGACSRSSRLIISSPGAALGKLYVKVKEEYDYNNDGTMDNVTNYTYDSIGNMTSQWSGSWTESYEYDSAGRLIGVTSNSPFTSTFTYDLTGRFIKRSYTDNTIPPATHNYVYDLSGYMVRDKFPSTGHNDFYYLDGRLIRFESYLSDGTVNITKYTYDAKGNKTKAEDSFSPPAGSTSVVVKYYTYDSKNRLIKEEIDSNNDTLIETTTTITYDSEGKMISKEVVSNGITTTTNYTYDSNGNCVKSSSSSGVTYYTWQAIN